MPKNKEETSQLREMRLKERKKKSSETPSEVYLCVLGNGAKGSPRSLYMFTTHTKYLFNCGEGTQRLAHEFKMKLSKLEHVFVTHNSWDNLGGLLGMSLTIQDIGVPQITLHGPPNIESIYTSTRSFIVTKELTIDKKHPEDSPFVDACMTVEYIPIPCLDTGSASTPEDNNNNDNDSENECNEEHKRKKRKRSFENASDVTVAYACKGHNKKGRLLLEKCVELGVPKGPLLGDLKNGKDVTLPSGKIVRSEDVISPVEPCPVFLVVECPSEKFLDPFVNEEKFVQYQSLSNDKENAQLVIHFTPSYIMQSSKYRSWMDKFPESTCHLILNEKCPTLNSIAIHKIQHMLNLFHPNIFCLLQESKLLENNMSVNTRKEFYAEALCKYYLRPDKGLDKLSCIKLEPEEFISEALNTPGFKQSLSKLQDSLNNLPKTDSADDFPEIVFLGTGSCIPSKVRNVSCILLNISLELSMLLDCGEGSYKQLLRLYGDDVAESILVKTSCIFISHMHADHHLGLLTVLKERKIAFERLGMVFYPALVIAPYCIKKWLLCYNRLYESISSLYRFIECGPLIYNNVQISAEEEEILKKTCDNVTVRTVPVIHCPNSFGVILELRNKKQKIVYSGDTVPCQELIEAGKNCTLLIHEATMEDDLADEAAIKKHSTTSQAIEVAQSMNAQYTMLTHFSQRYAKVPLFNEHFQGHIGFAFDNMKIKLSDLPKIPLFIPGLQILFAEHVEKLQDRGVKRKDKMKKQLCVSSVENLEINS